MRVKKWLMSFDDSRGKYFIGQLRAIEISW